MSSHNTQRQKTAKTFLLHLAVMYYYSIGPTGNTINRPTAFIRSQANYCADVLLCYGKITVVDKTDTVILCTFVIFVFRCLLIQMYSQEDAMDVGAPSLGNERRYEYKKLVMRALADVRRNFAHLPNNGPLRRRNNLNFPSPTRVYIITHSDPDPGNQRGLIRTANCKGWPHFVSRVPVEHF